MSISIFKRILTHFCVRGQSGSCNPPASLTAFGLNLGENMSQLLEPGKGRLSS